MFCFRNRCQSGDGSPSEIRSYVVFVISVCGVAQVLLQGFGRCGRAGLVRTTMPGLFSPRVEFLLTADDADPGTSGSVKNPRHPRSSAAKSRHLVPTKP